MYFSVVERDEEMACPKCADGSHPGKCFICEHPGSLEFYKTKATVEELALIIVCIKLCAKDANELNEVHIAREKEEIQKTVC